MATDEVEVVLANWIEQALAPIGQLPEGMPPATWIASRFTEWWRGRVADPLDDAERAAASVREELMRLGGWASFGEALHELIHLSDALADLRAVLGPPTGGDA